MRNVEAIINFSEKGKRKNPEDGQSWEEVEGQILETRKVAPKALLQSFSDLKSNKVSGAGGADESKDPNHIFAKSIARIDLRAVAFRIKLKILGLVTSDVFRSDPQAVDHERKQKNHVRHQKNKVSFHFDLIPSVLDHALDGFNIKNLLKELFILVFFSQARQFGQFIEKVIAGVVLA